MCCAEGNTGRRWPMGPRNDHRKRSQFENLNISNELLTLNVAIVKKNQTDTTFEFAIVIARCKRSLRKFTSKSRNNRSEKKITDTLWRWNERKESRIVDGRLEISASKNRTKIKIFWENNELFEISISGLHELCNIRHKGNQQVETIGNRNSRK